MSHANHASGFGTLLSTLAALTSPAQGFAGARPAGREAPRLQGAAGGRFKTVLAAAWQRYERARVRRALEQLDDHLLRDIGISRAQVSAGLLPPFAPADERATRAPGKNLTGRW